MTRCVIALDTGPAPATHIRDVTRKYQRPRFDGWPGSVTDDHELAIVHIDGEPEPRLVARERVVATVVEAHALVPEPVVFDTRPASAPTGCALGGSTHGQLR